MDSQIGIELKLGADRLSLPFLVKRKSRVSMRDAQNVKQAPAIYTVETKSCVVQDALNVKQALAIYLGYITWIREGTNAQTAVTNPTGSGRWPPSLGESRMMKSLCTIEQGTLSMQK